MKYGWLILLLLFLQSCEKKSSGGGLEKIDAHPDLYPYSEPVCAGAFANFDCVSSNFRVQTLYKDPVVTKSGDDLYQFTLEEKMTSDPIVLTVAIRLGDRENDTNLKITDQAGAQLTDRQISMQYYSDNYVNMVSKTGYAHLKYLDNNAWELIWCDAGFYNSMKSSTETVSHKTIVVLP